MRVPVADNIKRDSSMGETRTTIGLRTATKEKLDQNRAPGQCYDGFLCQLVDLWEKIKEEKREVMPI